MCSMTVLMCSIILNKLDTLSTRTVLGNSLLTTRNSGLTNLTPVARLLLTVKSGCSNKTYKWNNRVISVAFMSDKTKRTKKPLGISGG